MRSAEEGLAAEDEGGEEPSERTSEPALASYEALRDVGLLAGERIRPCSRGAAILGRTSGVMRFFSSVMSGGGMVLLLIRVSTTSIIVSEDRRSCVHVEPPSRSKSAKMALRRSGKERLIASSSQNANV